jgi:PadR family transcriptional regulator PadR
LGAFEEQILVAVLRTRDEAYGMSVRREIEQVTGRELTIGAVYATLDRLEAKGLLSSTRRRVGQESATRRVFAVTPSGKLALADTLVMRERLYQGVDLRQLSASRGRDLRRGQY